MHCLSFLRCLRCTLRAKSTAVFLLLRSMVHIYIGTSIYEYSCCLSKECMHTRARCSRWVVPIRQQAAAIACFSISLSHWLIHYCGTEIAGPNQDDNARMINIHFTCVCVCVCGIDNRNKKEVPHFVLKLNKEVSDYRLFICIFPLEFSLIRFHCIFPVYRPSSTIRRQSWTWPTGTISN